MVNIPNCSFVREIHMDPLNHDMGFPGKVIAKGIANGKVISRLSGLIFG